MLPSGITYPVHWPVSYIARDGKQYACTIIKVHFDDVDPYYTVDVLEGPASGERQTVSDRLSSWIDTYDPDFIRKTFYEFIMDVLSSTP